MNTERKTPHFTAEDIKLLREMLFDEGVIFNKKTDHVSSRMKDEAWARITDRFNAESSCYKTTKQLKYKYGNLMKSAKKEVAEEKTETRKTGGGLPRSRPSQSTEMLRQLMPTTIEGLPSRYDDDADSNSECEEMPAIPTAAHSNNKLVANPLYVPKKQMNQVTCVNNGNGFNNLLDVSKAHETVIDEEFDIFDSSTPKSSLRKPVSNALCVPRAKKHVQTASIQQTRKKICVLADAKKSFTDKKVEILRHAEEEHVLLQQLRREKAQREEAEHQEKMKQMKREELEHEERVLQRKREEGRAERLFEANLLLLKAQHQKMLLEISKLR